MSFRESFECLWCGAAWTVRDPNDLEGWAQLCPSCLGKAGENPFLRRRLRAALDERAAVREAVQEVRPAVDDSWYLRRGAHQHGPIQDAAFQAELDAAGQWLDRLPLGGRIVELAAGHGWWSPLLAGKGELWLYDADSAALDRARDRLVAHGLRAHLHVRDPWAEPDGAADALFCGLWLSRVPPQRLPAFLDLAHRWLRPDGRFAFIDPADELASSGLREALPAAGFREAEVISSGQVFVLGTAIA